MSPSGNKLPPGVQAFDETEARKRASQNIVMTLFGDSKTGKTHFALRSGRPLYIVYLDAQQNLDDHLLKAAVEENPITEKPFGDETYDWRMVPMNGEHYSDFTQKDAEKAIKEIEGFAEWAKARAVAAAAKDEPVGTFIVDGATWLKGYYEKALLGESSTLGYRAKKGERGGPSVFEYAQSNSALFEFISGFSKSPLDVIIIFEGRPVYRTVVKPTGGRTSEKTTRFRSTRPDRIPFAVGAEIETLKIIEEVKGKNNTSTKKSVPQIRVVWSGYDMGFDNVVMPATTFVELKQLFQDLLPEDHKMLTDQKNIEDVERTNTHQTLSARRAEAGEFKEDDDDDD